MSQQYSDNEIIEMLRKCNGRYGECTRDHFSQGDEFCPVSTVMNRFGSWANALTEAGLDPEADSNPGRPREYTDEQILRMLRDVANEYGNATMENLREAKRDADQDTSDDYVSPSTVVDRFGSWTGAKKKAGLSGESADSRKKNPRPREYTTEEYLELVRECKEKHGKVTQRVFDDDDEFPSSGAVRKRFGAWSEAKARAGVSDQSGEGEKYSREDLLEDLRTCQERHGKCTARVFDNDESFASYHTVVRRFGSWETAKELAGLGDGSNDVRIDVFEDSNGELYARVDEQTLDRIAAMVAERI